MLSLNATRTTAGTGLKQRNYPFRPLLRVAPKR